MSEINKVMKQYGDTAGRMYLTLLHSYMEAAVVYEIKNDKDGLESYKVRFEQYAKKTFGVDFYNDYKLFAKDAYLNKKLRNELAKRHSDFISKAVLDLAKEPEKKKQESGQTRTASSATQTNSVQNPNSAKKQPVSNYSRHGSVNLKGMKAEFDYNEPDTAIPIVKSAVFLQPHDADNWCTLGNLYIEKKEWSSAGACFSKALVKNPKSERALSGRAKARQLSNGTEYDKTSNNNAGAWQTPPAKKEPVKEDVIYYFENQEEFILYVALNKDKEKGNIIWGKGTQYQDECKRGYLLYDQKRFQQAVDAYQNALRFNPVGVSARFEICSAYSQMHMIPDARKALKEVEQYLYSDKLIAKYYRCLGYILIEEKNYIPAACCYQYSLYLDPDQQMAKQEILFIVNQAGFDVMDAIRDRQNVEKTLKSAGIVLINDIESK